MSTNNTYRYIEVRDENNNLVLFQKVKATCSLDKITTLQEECARQNALKNKKALEEKEKLAREKERKEFLDTYSYDHISSIMLPLILSGKITNLNFLIELAKIEDKEVLANRIIQNLELPQFALVKELFRKQYLANKGDK